MPAIPAIAALVHHVDIGVTAIVRGAAGEYVVTPMDDSGASLAVDLPQLARIEDAMDLASEALRRLRFH
jgi:hypothetical protein